MLADLPEYEQDDPTIQALINVLARELQRIEDHLMDLSLTIQPGSASGKLLSYWEGFLGIPVAPDGVTAGQRIITVKAAVARRNAGNGEGWAGLLTTVLEGAPWRHLENADASSGMADYRLQIDGVQVPTTSYRVGIFRQMARFITPAHLEISEIELAGEDTFRVGISEVGDGI